MIARAIEGTCLATLVGMAIPVCQQAARACPRKGPGRRRDSGLGVDGAHYGGGAEGTEEQVVSISLSGSPPERTAGMALHRSFPWANDVLRSLSALLALSGRSDCHRRPPRCASRISRRAMRGCRSKRRWRAGTALEQTSTDAWPNSTRR
jgi:hypothetical protein